MKASTTKDKRITTVDKDSIVIVKDSTALDKKSTKLSAIISIAFLILLWKAVSLIVASELLLPAPEAAFEAVVTIFRSEGFASMVGHTLLRGLTGFALSLVLGLGVGVLAGLNGQINALVKPLLVTIRSTPVIAVILLAIIWFKSEYVPIFTGFLMMFPIVCTNVIEGIRSVDSELAEMAEIYGVGRAAVLLEVYMPAIGPFLVSGVSTALGIGWKAVVASEVLSQPPKAIGTAMHSAQTYLMVPEVLAWTIVAVSISYVFEVIIHFIEKKTMVWR